MNQNSRLNRYQHTLLHPGAQLIWAMFWSGIIAARHMDVEQYFYFWDWVTYHDLAVGLLADFRTGWSTVPQSIQSKLGWEYNNLFAIPLVPLLFILGTSRAAFITAMAIAYLAPFIWALSQLISKLNPQWSARTAQFLMLNLFLLSPYCWAPLLRGFPDIGAVLIFVLILWVVAADVALRRPHTWCLVLSLLVLLPLFRRQYTYEFVLMLPILASPGIVRAMLPEQADQMVHKLKTALYIGLRATILWSAAVLLLWIVATSFVEQSLTLARSQLYDAWNRPFTERASFYASFFGLVSLIIAASGWILAARRHWKSAHFILIAGAAHSVLFVWLFVVKAMDEHYNNHFLVWVMAGWGLLVVELFSLKLRGLRLAGCALLAGFALFQFHHSIPGAFGKKEPAPANVWLPKQTLPLNRSDFSELIRLVEVLRAQGGTQTPVLIAGVTGMFNESLLQQVDRNAFGEYEDRLDMIYRTIVDSRDPLTTEDIARAGWVLVTEPFLGTDETLWLHTYHKHFYPQLQWPDHFVQMEEVFTLEHGVVVRIYQRLAPLALEHLFALATEAVPQIRQRYPHKNLSVPLRAQGVLHNQPDWTGKSVSYYLSFPKGTDGELLSIAFTGSYKKGDVLNGRYWRSSNTPEIEVRVFPAESPTSLDPIPSQRLNWDYIAQTGLLIEHDMPHGFVLQFNSTIPSTEDEVRLIAAELHWAE